MSPPLQQWITLGVLAFFGHVALRPALAAAAPAAPEAGPPPAAAAPAPAPVAPPAPAGTPAPAPYPQPYYGQYPPPGYQPYPQQPYQQYPQQYQPYPQPPRQLVTEHRPRRGLVIGGAVLFGVTWGLAASISLLATDGSLCSTANCRDMMEVLWIPIAGPALAGARDSGSDGTATWILWSVAELAGVTMFVIGVIGHDVTTYKLAGRGGPTLQLSPLLARDTSGMALTARW
jgi:hypothetical protein